MGTYGQRRPTVAYFCMEFGLDESFPVYSGGLGILAGDLLKAAKDLDLPFIGVGILWDEGYTDQFIDKDLRPYDCARVFQNMIDRVTVTVKIRNQDVKCQVWKTEVRQCACIFDASVDPENAWITRQL